MPHDQACTDQHEQLLEEIRQVQRALEHHIGQSHADMGQLMTKAEITAADDGVREIAQQNARMLQSVINALEGEERTNELTLEVKRDGGLIHMVGGLSEEVSKLRQQMANGGVPIRLSGDQWAKILVALITAVGAIIATVVALP